MYQWQTARLPLLLLFLLWITAIVVDATPHNESCKGTKHCVDGLVLPAWTPQENITWGTRIFRAIIYLLALAYMFLGVSIVADRFMAAIEVITSQEREVKLKKITGEPYTILIRVWNETVSNLTLMALGSSAPEILLSVIEIIGNNFEAGDLGPGTIVGSAAFNLFIIIAICILVIPSPDVRRVQHYGVFWVTVAWSTFAYVWLYLIIAVISPGVIAVWEGLLTFLFFPLTVLTSYLADRYTGIFGQRLLTMGQSSFMPRQSPTRTPKTELENGPSHRDSLLGDTKDADAAVFEANRMKYLEIFKKLRAENPDIAAGDLEKMATDRATRLLVGAGDITAKKHKKTSGPQIVKKKVAVVSFDPAHYMCLENCGTIKVIVHCDRSGLPVDDPSIVTVHYRTVPDTAHEQEDFIPTEGVLTFAPDEIQKEIEIGIVDNDVYEDDEQFNVQLSNVKAVSATDETRTIASRLGAASTAIVLIVDDDHAGAFGFASEKFKVAENDGAIVLQVFRTRGARGEVEVPYRTIDGAAKANDDYVPVEGMLLFKDEQSSAEIEVQIINDDEYEKNEEFFVELGEPIWHRPATIGEDVEMGKPVLSEHPRCKVVITENKEFKNFVDKILVNANTSLMVGTSSWKEQFAEAIELENEDQGMKEKVMHYLSLPWKVLFALIPPTDYLRGWLCFIVAITVIGLLTAVIGDLASHFGCTVGLKDSVTAISLVAMGTSIPDTFASRTAAIQDRWADSSIGNVTGSNAVNVFLGIGIAWAIAAIIHWTRGTTFRVHSGSLGFSVTMFLIGSVICIFIMQIRRFSPRVQGELGGPRQIKLFTSAIFVLVWVLYLLLSTLEAYCVIPGF